MTKTYPINYIRLNGLTISRHYEFHRCTQAEILRYKPVSESINELFMHYRDSLDIEAWEMGKNEFEPADIDLDFLRQEIDDFYRKMMEIIGEFAFIEPDENIEDFIYAQNMLVDEYRYLTKRIGRYESEGERRWA